MNRAAYTICRDNRLPSLSWLFQLGSNGAQLTCGPAVESAADGFFEGAWAGSFAARGFHDCPDVFGSGACFTADGWTLVPPSHTLEPVYVLQSPKGDWAASNSLAFLITATGLGLNFRSRSVMLKFIEVLDGIAGAPPHISTQDGRLHLLYHHNAVLGSDLKIRQKPKGGPFRHYQDYRDHLASVMAMVAENAAHQDRRTRYRLLATVSSGYDSPACATLARSAGCNEGVTFLRSRDGASDDGCEIGQYLGLRMISIQHPLFSDDVGIDDLVRTAEFFATGMQGEDITYEVLSGLLHERLLVTGAHGDHIWDIFAKPSADLVRVDIASSSLGEFRLRENFIHLPLPFVGSRQPASVHAISQAREMQPYVVGGSYDRPIPRRIAEEAGVPRALFGQSKKAVTTLVFSNRRLLPEAMRRAVEARIREEPVLARIRFRLGSTWYAAGMQVVYGAGDRISGHLPPALARIYRRARSKILRIIWPQPFKIFEHMDPISGYAMEWAQTIVAERYRHLNNQENKNMNGK